MSVWFGPKVALSELSCSFGPGVTGPARAERRRQDDADAGDHRDDRRQPGPGARRRPRPAPRPPRPRRAWPSSPRTRPCPAGLTARQFVRYTADLHGIADRGAPDAALATVGHARRRRPARRRLQQGHAPAHQDRLGARVRSAGAGARRAAQRRRPGAAGQPDQPVPPARRRRAHGDRQLARAQRGRAAGRAGDRARPRTARRRRRPPGDPRRHGRPPAPRARAGRRTAPPGRGARRARLGRRRDVRPRPATGSSSRPCGPASWPSPCPGWPATRRSGCSRCGRSTTRWRACSGSSCDDRADDRRTADGRPTDRGRACSPSSSTRCSRASRRGGGRPSSRPAPAPCCSGCSPTPSTNATGAGLRQRRRRGHPRAGRADRRPRHRRRRARRRDPRRHVPVHVDVADTDLADRARPVDRRLARRPGDDRPGVRRRRRSSPARRRASGRSSSPPPSRRSPTSPCSSPSAASPGARRCGRWRSCSSSSGCSAPPSRASPSSRRRGSRGRSSSACSTTRRERLVREGIPSGGGAVVRLLIVSAVALAVATWRMRHLRLSGAAD